MRRRPLAKPLAYYEQQGRRGMALAYLSGDYTMQAIADHFGLYLFDGEPVGNEFELKVRD